MINCNEDKTNFKETVDIEKTIHILYFEANLKVIRIFNLLALRRGILKIQM